MLCVYFEIPYERQLVRIAPFEIQKMLDTIAESAKEYGAFVYTIPLARVYAFSGTEAGMSFSTYLFLQRLSQVLRTHKERVFDYRVIVDCCEKSGSEDSLREHFAAYATVLLPRCCFVASVPAEKLLKSYIMFSFMSEQGLYSCDRFIIPKPVTGETEKNPYRVYLHDDITWMHALYHFMLLYPVSEKEVLGALSKEDQTRYNEVKHVLYYFRQRRFCTEYPAYVTDAFLAYSRLYFAVFRESYSVASFTLVYSPARSEDVDKILSIFPDAHKELLQEKSVNLANLPIDFLYVAYLTIYASRFIFEDEMQAFFLSIRKGSVFVTKLYEWMYATGITDIKHDAYSVNRHVLTELERLLGVQKDRVKPHIAAFLQEKYQNGLLSPDDNFNNTFFVLHHHLNDACMLHYIFYKYSDKDIINLNISPFKKTSFFEVLENYRKALALRCQQDVYEAIRAVKRAVTAVQALKLPAGEYRVLSCIAFISLSENRIDDALTYFHYALDSAEFLHDSRFTCDALFNLSVSYFVRNNLFAAREYGERLLRAVRMYFEKPQEVPCLFMLGRIALELGNYPQAEALFQQAEKAASTYFREWVPLCIIWYARALSQQGQQAKAKPLLIAHLDESPDAAAFLLESLLLLPPPFVREELVLKDIPFDQVPKPFQSGFAPAEELVWGHLYGKPALRVFYEVVDAAYRFRLAVSESEETAHIYLKKLEETAYEALKNRDIHASFYLYLCYDAVLLSKKADSDAANGYLSRSFKILKDYMDSMTESSFRDAFISENVWNAKIYAAAQKNTLI